MRDMRDNALVEVARRNPRRRRRGGRDEEQQHLDALLSRENARRWIARYIHGRKVVGVPLKMGAAGAAANLVEGAHQIVPPLASMLDVLGRNGLCVVIP